MVRARHRSHRSGPRGPWLMLALAALLAPGCKSGTWAAKPSWWSFGGTTPPSSLAAAPAFEGEVTKPSEAAKPYPTTDTPAAYSLTESTRTDPAAGPEATPSAVIDPTSVTYGSTPPPAAPAGPQATAAVAPTAQPSSAIGPQVGPYASLEPATPAAVDPAAAATAGFAAAPAFGTAAPPAQDRYASTDPGIATPRNAEAWAAPAAAGGDSRYNAATGSRFSGGVPQQPFPQPSASSPAMPEPAAAASPTAGFNPGPSIDPAPSFPTPPATAAPTAAGDVLPGDIAPPKRRQDPGYRPGGTSSYRPNRAILAGEEPPAGVVPASFEAAASAP